MHGPDGTDQQIAKDFLELAHPERTNLQNLEPTHRFRMTMTFRDEANRTRLTWRMQFESVEEAKKVRDAVAERTSRISTGLKRKLQQMA